MISSQRDGQEVDHTSSEWVVNKILVELKACKTGWRAAFKSQVEVDRYKEQLLKACVEGGINKIEMIDRGLAEARRDESDFFPSIGKFINWCKPKEHYEHRAMRAATREFNANQKRLSHNKVNKDVGNAAIQNLKKSLRILKDAK